jgi:hypothetical protein
MRATDYYKEREETHDANNDRLESGSTRKTSNKKYIDEQRALQYGTTCALLASLLCKISIISDGD